MELTAVAQQLIYNLKKLNLTEDDLNQTFPSESMKCAPTTPISAVVYCTEIKERRKQKARITPYTPRSSMKARKSLNF